ncbi:class I SAM-dependent methyltransferase [Pelagibacterales bacterium SAG-MED13]|nr:class I SAM-dependent methyltransferase [Pelagibacterales bacterium SAG-MED13]
MIDFLNKRLSILKVNKIYLKLVKIYFNIFGEKNLGNIGFDFSNKPSRIEILNKIIKTQKYSKYLEIGTFKDELFTNIICENKIGVDPFSGGTHRMTSDTFFQINKEKFDCIFIDGLHHYSQVSKDIHNAIQILNDNGVILIHDCLPNNLIDQLVPRITLNWNGDVWKAFVECRTKSNLDCFTCNADWGIGVIFKRKNSNLLKLKEKNFKKLKYSFFFHNYKKLMNIIEFEDLLRKF